MSDLKRIIELSGVPLKESHFDPQTDEEITSHLSGYSKEQLILAFDALDILRGAGHKGISGVEWAKMLKQVHPEVESVSALLGDLSRKLYNLRIERGGEGFQWIPEGTAEIEPEMRRAMTSHMDLASEALKIAKELKQFSQTQLARALMSRANADPDKALQTVVQMVVTNPTMFKRQADGTYLFVDPAGERRPAMDIFRDIAANPGHLDD